MRVSNPLLESTHSINIFDSFTICQAHWVPASGQPVEDPPGAIWRIAREEVWKGGPRLYCLYPEGTACSSDARDSLVKAP